METKLFATLPMTYDVIITQSREWLETACHKLGFTPDRDDRDSDLRMWLLEHRGSRVS